MDVNTGAILAMTVKGDYDPNDPYTITDEADLEAINAIPDDEEHAEERAQALRTAQEKQWRNKCISDTYNPGSVFKMITASMGIEEGIVNENTTFSCGGSYRVADRNIGCWKLAGHGTETFAQGLSNSCNPVFMQLGEKIGATTFFRYFEAFGLTRKTGIDLIGESNSIYYDADGLGPTELATSSFGQSFRVTPIQMITAAAAVANGGYLVQPHVVSQILDSEGNIVETVETEVKRQVISEDTSARVSAMLQETATTGTAKNGYVAGYRIAGKTGTSEKIDEWNAAGREGEKKYIASYCGYAPADTRYLRVPQVIMPCILRRACPQNGEVFGSANRRPALCGNDGGNPAVSRCGAEIHGGGTRQTRHLHSRRHRTRCGGSADEGEQRGSYLQDVRQRLHRCLADPRTGQEHSEGRHSRAYLDESSTSET